MKTVLESLVHLNLHFTVSERKDVVAPETMV